MISVEKGADGDMSVRMVGDGLTLDQEMAYLTALYRESVIRESGKEKGKERYKTVVKSYKNPFLHSIIEREGGTTE